VRRERRLVLQVPEILIEVSANIVVKAESVQVSVVRLRVSVPCGWGTAPPFIGQGESSLQACRTIFLRVEAWRALPRS
jgi:hypothetical protein